MSISSDSDHFMDLAVLQDDVTRFCLLYQFHHQVRTAYVCEPRDHYQ